MFPSNYLDIVSRYLSLTEYTLQPETIPVFAYTEVLGLLAPGSIPETYGQ